MSDHVREISLRAAASRLASDAVGYWRGELIYDPAEDGPIVARHVLAELDETPPSPDLLKPLGFVEKDGEWSIKIPSVRMVLSWSPVNAALKEPGDFPMPHTMGQIRTLLRVFGVPQKELP